MDVQNPEDLILEILNKLGVTSFSELMGVYQNSFGTVKPEELKNAILKLRKRKAIEVKEADISPTSIISKVWPVS